MLSEAPDRTLRMSQLAGPDDVVGEPALARGRSAGGEGLGTPGQAPDRPARRPGGAHRRGLGRRGRGRSRPRHRRTRGDLRPARSRAGRRLRIDQRADRGPRRALTAGVDSLRSMASSRPHPTRAPQQDARPRETHKGPVTLRREQVERSTTDQRLLDTRGPTDWVHTDPWRVLRIQSEFVEGFGALAELGRAISVFGSARVHRATTPSTRSAMRRRPALAEAGYAVITGGGPGVDGGGQPGRLRGRRRLGRARHRAALRAGHERVGRHRRRLPLLLRPQDDVREVRAGVRRAARRVRHLRRAVRGADARADHARSPRSRSCCSGTPTGAAWSTGCRSTVLAGRQDRRARPRPVHRDRRRRRGGADRRSRRPPRLALDERRPEPDGRGGARRRRASGGGLRLLLVQRARSTRAYVELAAERRHRAGARAGTAWSAAAAACRAWARSPARRGPAAPTRSA